MVYSLVLNGRITVNVFDSEYDGISSSSDSKLSLVNFWSTHCIYFSEHFDSTLPLRKMGVHFGLFF